MNSQSKEALRRDDENARPIKDPKLIVAEAYDQIAERYLKWRGQQPREGELARWLGLLSDEVQPGARVLDICCGAGIPLTEALSKTFNFRSW